MTRLATQAELIKLAQIMGVAPEQLHFMHEIPPESLRHFRLALMELLFERKQAFFRWLSMWTYWLPTWLIVPIISLWIEPVYIARIASALPAWRVHRIARHLSPSIMASVAFYLDPRVARELVQLLQARQLIEITQALLKRQDYVTIGRFVGMLDDDVVQQVAAAITDESNLLEIAFHIEPRERLDHLVHVLPEARIHRAILLICEPEKRQVWPKLLAFMSNIGYAMKRKLGDLAVSQGEQVMNALIEASQQDDLWEDMLPVVACLSPPAQRTVVNLASLREPAIMQRIIWAADACNLWTDMLTIASYMQDEARTAVAQAIAAAPGRILHRIAYATLLRAQWPITLDIVRRLPVERQMECHEILSQYFEVLDQETFNYLDQLLVHYGIAMHQPAITHA